MSATARYIVEAVIRERRSPVELARTHKVSRSWIYNQLERFHRGGYEALAPRSRRPRSSANQVDSEVQQLIAKLRRSPNHSLPPQPQPGPAALGHHHLAHPQAPGPGHPAATQATPLFLHPL